MLRPARRAAFLPSCLLVLMRSYADRSPPHRKQPATQRTGGMPEYFNKIDDMLHARITFLRAD